MEATTATAKPSASLLHHNNQANQILFNAIKTKFASSLTSKDSQTIHANLTTFAVPKTATTATTTTRNYHHDVAPPLNTTTTIPASPLSGISPSNKMDTKSSLNDFLLDQLNNKHLNGDSFQTNNGFILPKLPIKNLTNSEGKSNPFLQNSSNNKTTMPMPSNTFNSLSFALKKKLNLEDTHTDKPKDIIINPSKMDVDDDDDEATNEHSQPEVASSLIDLSIALNTSHDIKKMKQNMQRTEEKFDIPFIDCDKRINQDLTKNISNVYCQVDVSGVHYKHCLMKPSSFGQVICSSYKGKKPKKSFCVYEFLKDSETKPIDIPKFIFDTKSPDDKVKESLSKFKRS